MRLPNTERGDPLGPPLSRKTSESSTPKEYCAQSFSVKGVGVACVEDAIEVKNDRHRTYGKLRSERSLMRKLETASGAGHTALNFSFCRPN